MNNRKRAAGLFLFVFLALLGRQVLAPLSSDTSNGSTPTSSAFLRREARTTLKSSHFHRTHLPAWQRGYLDIHHILSGPSVATFIIFPDGTTLLIDTGELDGFDFRKRRGAIKSWRKYKEILEPYPDTSRSAAEWVVAYMKQFWPRPSELKSTISKKRLSLDYMLVTHFHQDHMGDLVGKRGEGLQEPSRRPGATYIRSGVTHIGDDFDIGKFIDRDYPTYSFPFDFSKANHLPSSLPNYRKFVEYLMANTSTTVERFQVGSRDQIKQQRTKPSKHQFVVRNIKANDKYSPALPNNRSVYKIEGQWLQSPTESNPMGKWDENEASTAICIEYGKFKYYTGGDQEFHDKDNSALEEFPKGIPIEPIALDTVTPTSQATGKVDVAIGNHHGHGIRPAYCNVMDPKIIIVQGWCNDQPYDHPLKMLLQPRKFDGSQRFLLATHLFASRIKRMEENLADAFASVQGHIVVRVSPPEELTDQQPYSVFVLDDERMVKDQFGPFYAEG